MTLTSHNGQYYSERIIFQSENAPILNDEQVEKTTSGVTAVPKRKKATKPYSVSEPKQRDDRVSDSLWGLPRRVEQANRDGGFNYSQLELAQKAELAQSVLSKIASYQNLVGLRVETIDKLSAALKVSVPWLLGAESGSVLDTLTMAREAAANLTELDQIPPEEAWGVMHQVAPVNQTADGYYVAAKRLLASRAGLTAHDLAAHKVKASKILDGGPALGRRKAR